MHTTTPSVWAARLAEGKTSSVSAWYYKETLPAQEKLVAASETTWTTELPQSKYPTQK
jgi:hypothetical protein